ncbi:MAG: 2-amino-4-hydroxy-6-hydroxymethyldihydropteridine diphosphokinase [Candidatus Omnitrophota bacterium]|jgi:2-amino-4-hydroxy-6-hydroxymethyldihydropteridine diphosphokinase
MAIVYIGIGSNKGDRGEYIEKALELIAEIPDTSIVSQSEVKEYPAVEVCAGQADFMNGVIELDSELLPLELLHKLQVIERRLDRVDKGDGAERSMDLDMLSYGEGIVFSGKTLMLPHPKIQSRNFVLEGLNEINPNWIHPTSKRTANELLADLLERPNENNPNAESSSASSAVSQES